MTYDESYYDHWLHGSTMEQVWAMKLDTSRAYLALLRRMMPERFYQGARLLDIGCAHGYMLQAAAEIGLEPYGIDISPAVEHAAGLGYRVRRATLTEAAFPRNFFDIITMIDVIEHSSDPRSLIEEIQEIGRPNAVLLMLTPNIAGIPARLLKGFWPHWKPEHVCYYCARSLHRLLGEYGFVPALVRRGFKFLYYDYVLAHYGKFSGLFPITLFRFFRHAIPNSLARRHFRLSTSLLLVAQRRQEPKTESQVLA